MFSANASSSAGAPETLMVEDVFAVRTHIGNGSSQSITNEINLSGDGGLVWVKHRTSASRDHILVDTARGATKVLYSSYTLAETTVAASITAFNSNGFSVGSSTDVNENTANIVSWTFRKAPKFFDIVTYTGDGTSGRVISHNLGVAPGMIMVKATSTSGGWYVYHRSTGTGYAMQLEQNYAAFTTTLFSAVSATSFTTSSGSGLNGTGVSYVAYVFAHNAAADGVIQCGSFTTDGSGLATVPLGWEPQYVLLKSSSNNESWIVGDTIRGLAMGTADARIFPNLINAEISGSIADLTPTGFIATPPSASQTYVYMAIRRGPMRQPTSGTQVYKALARTGTGVTERITGVGFTPDLVAIKERSSADNNIWFDRFRGAPQKLFTDSSSAEISEATNKLDVIDGYGIGTGSDVNASGSTYITHFFRRFPGVFDIVCYTGTGSAGTISHNLGVVPEFIIQKPRTGTADWPTYHASLGANYQSRLNYNIVPDGPSSIYWNNTSPTASVFSVGTSTNTNPSGVQCVAYLFATLAGISKVGSYTGNGTSQTINCGFSGGARFILIKRTDSTGDWYVWDSVRGIVASNDPRLSFNSTSAEVTTDDSVDPDSSGFVVNQNSTTNINVSSATYIYLALA